MNGVHIRGGATLQVPFTPSQGTVLRHSPGRPLGPLLPLLDPSAISARLWGLVCYGWSDPETKCAEMRPSWSHQGGLNLGLWASPHWVGKTPGSHTGHVVSLSGTFARSPAIPRQGLQTQETCSARQAMPMRTMAEGKKKNYTHPWLGINFPAFAINTDTERMSLLKWKRQCECSGTWHLALASPWAQHR